MTLTMRRSSQKHQSISINTLGKATRAAPRFKVRSFTAKNQQIDLPKKRSNCSKDQTKELSLKNPLMWLMGIQKLT